RGNTFLPINTNLDLESLLKTIHKLFIQKPKRKPRFDSKRPNTARKGLIQNQGRVVPSTMETQNINQLLVDRVQALKREVREKEFKALHAADKASISKLTSAQRQLEAAQNMQRAIQMKGLPSTEPPEVR